MIRSTVHARNVLVPVILCAAAAIAAAATAGTATPAADSPPASPATRPATRPASGPASGPAHAAAAVPPRPYPAQPADPAGPLDFRVTGIDGEERDLRAYDGYVILLVNTASRCGLTPQYAGLQRLYDRYHDHKFVVLAFPANDFLGQEPGADEDILKFATQRYKVTFPLMSKVSVKGERIHPLYQYLTAKDTGGAFAGDVEWNFAKFLIGRDGTAAGRFPAKMVPEDPQVLAAVEAALGLTPEQVAALPPLPQPPAARPAAANAPAPATRPAAP